MDGWLSIDDVYSAYLDCRKRKRNTTSCAMFESNEAENIVKLWEELNNGTYKIGVSIAFCVTRPKIREVFAANFRDRIVHHLIMMRLGYLFEESFIDDTYNCRVGKGNLRGAQALNCKMQDEDCWVLKCDLKGFFMTINKDILSSKLEYFIRANYHRDDIEQVIWLVKKVVMHRPQMLCDRHGNLGLWKLLPKDKSLFTCSPNKGLAIGNLTSQIFANFYLSEFDHKMVELTDNHYCRYVDDIVITGNHDYLLTLLPYMRKYLKDNLEVTLHPNKVFFQHRSKSVTFIGITLKNFRTYCSNRTVNNAFMMVKEYNKIALKYTDTLQEFAEKFIQCYNSYMGFMVHHYTYAIRYNLWNYIDDNLKAMFKAKRGFKSISVLNEYKNQTKLFLEYEQNKCSRRRICSIGTCT